MSDSLECGCNLNNSKIQNCDSNGKCTCKEKYSGFECTNCASGYIGYPECQGLLCKQIVCIYYVNFIKSFHSSSQIFAGDFW